MGKDRDMQCSQVQSLIQTFMDDNLEFGQMRGFMKHLKSCDECRDEFENRFLVYEGMRKIESGEDFNFEDEVREKLKVGDAFVKAAFRTKAALAVLIAVVAAALLCYRLGIFGL